LQKLRQQLAKPARDADRPLDGQVVVISGGAGAIGAAVAEGCAEAGAHVVVTDLDAERLDKVIERVERRCGDGTAAAVVMDVTDEASVRRGFEEVCRLYGGVDVIVPNAGVAHVAPIDELALADFRRVMEVNVTGYLLFMREGIRILKQQALGGHIVINSSKNVFGPGKDFGAYSASKAAGHQLGKVAAIELAPHGIRVNMINADAVFGHEDIPSGLWAEVGPQRAQSRGMKIDELPEYYRGRNLLRARVYGHHVANAVVFFASNATPTTGATLPVDGGVVEAFPR
jgi:NAD(P)-dependent dehydrogenase (short-subunit alcohol dehydrogenase family)